MSLSRTEIKKKIASIIKEYAVDNPEHYDENSQLIADIGFNSLDLMCIVNDLEDEFDIVIDDADVYSIVTVKDAIDLIKKKKES